MNKHLHKKHFLDHSKCLEYLMSVTWLAAHMYFMGEELGLDSHKMHP